MREIKFRVWDGIHKFYHSNSSCMTIYGKTVVIDGISFDLRYSKLEQFTDLTDKNGRKVYFGDKYYDESLKRVSIVDELTRANWIIEEDRMNFPMSRVEVIGNIHEQEDK